jgi:signal transduction histidine kinase
VNQLQLELDKDKLYWQNLQAADQEATLMLIQKETEIKEQNLEKQKLVRNGVIFAVLAIVIGALLYINGRQLKKKLEEQNAIARERRRISSDLGEDVGPGLSEISRLSEIVRINALTPEAKAGAERIASTSKELLSDIREIIWALNSNNDYVESLITYIGRYAEAYFENTDVKLKIIMPAGLPDVPINGESRRNVFYSVKEALHNILKHSGATRAEVIFSVSGGQLTIVLSDNGSGILEGGQNRFGNGLRNMRNRMEAVNGLFTIESNGGAKVTLSLPV